MRIDTRGKLRVCVCIIWWNWSFMSCPGQFVHSLFVIFVTCPWVFNMCNLCLTRLLLYQHHKAAAPRLPFFSFCSLIIEQSSGCHLYLASYIHLYIYTSENSSQTKLSTHYSCLIHGIFYSRSSFLLIWWGFYKLFTRTACFHPFIIQICAILNTETCLY